MQVPPKNMSTLLKDSTLDENPFKVLYNYRKTKLLRKAR